MSVLDSKATDSLRTMQFAVNGAQDRLEKVESANIFAGKMGQKVVGIAFAEKSVIVTSLKSSSNEFDPSKGLNSHERDLKSATEIVDIALARHLEGVALESMTDDSLATPEVALDNQPSDNCDEQQRPNRPRTPTPVGGIEVPTVGATPESDLAIVVCFRSTPDIGQPAFPYSGMVFPLHFGCTIIGRGKLQCLKHGYDELMEIPHNSVSKRHAKIDVSSDGSVSITDTNSTNGTCIGSSIESIMQGSKQLEQNTAVSIGAGDYVSFGVCVCRIIPERARTGKLQTQEGEVKQFQPSIFALDQLRILKITMNLHRMVDEEGFSPIEMARLMSDKLGAENNATRMLGEPWAAGNAISSQPVAETSKHRPTSILKLQHSPALGVKFDVQNVSDDDDEEYGQLQSYGAGDQDDSDVKSGLLLNRPSTSNFFENRSEMNSGRVSVMDSIEGSLNLDTHTGDEVMRKMVLRLSQITKDLAQIQTVVLGKQNFGYPDDTKNRPIDGATGLQRTGSIKFDSKQPQSSVHSPHVQIARSQSVNGQNLLDGSSSPKRNNDSDSYEMAKLSSAKHAQNDLMHPSSSDSKGTEKLDHISEILSVEGTFSDLRQHKSMKGASKVVTTEIGTIRCMEKFVLEGKQEAQNRQLTILMDRSSELNSKCYSFGMTKSGNKVRLYASALIHIFSFIDPIPGIFMVAGVNREMRTFCKNDDLFFNLNLGHEKLRGTHVHEKVTDKIIADMVMHRFRQVKIVNLQGCPFVTDQSLKAFIGHCQNLEELNLGRLMDIGPQITDAGMQLLIPHCVTLRNLDLSWLERLTDTAILCVADSCTRLESLDVPNLYQLTNACIARLGSSASQTTLKNLNLCGCSYIGDAAGFVIAQKFVNLMTLNLAGCDRIGPDSMVEIVSKLRLRSLNITGLYRLNDKCLIDMSPHVGNLIRLRIGFLRCTDEGVGCLVKGLKNVTQFDMRGISDITDLSVVIICQNMNNLRVIDLRGCRNVSVSARLMLAAKLEKNAKLGEMRMTTAIYADGC